MKALASCIAAGAIALAQAGPARAAGPDCTAEAAEMAELGDRSGSIRAMERLPEACLKRLVLECHRAAGERMLDLGSAAMCSMGYEALLRKGFGGDFQALMAWWRGDRGVE